MLKYKHIRTKNFVIKIKKPKILRVLQEPTWFQNKHGAWRLNTREPKFYKGVRIPRRSQASRKISKLKREIWAMMVTAFALRSRWKHFYKFLCAYAILYIIFRRRNTFITVAVKKQPKATISAGILNYKGRKKTSPFVKERLGAQIGIFCRRNNIKLIDLVLSKKARRSYKTILKGVAKAAKAAIRGITVRKLKGHGYTRPKKKRRI